MTETDTVRRLRDEIVANYSRARLEVELGHLDRNLEAISTDHDLPTIVGKVIADARRRGWFAQLLDWASHEPYPGLAGLAQRMLTVHTTAGPPAAADPWAATSLNGVPYLGQRDLRSALRTLLSPAPERVMSVDGERGSGRSHFWYFVSHVAAADGGIRPLLVDLAGDGRNRLGAAGLTERIRLGLGLPAPDLTPQTSSDPVRLLSGWLGGRLGVQTTATMLVLDGSADAELDDDAVALIRCLGDLADRRQVRNLTVVLLGIAGIARDGWAVARARTAAIGPDDVAAHLREVAEDLGVDLEAGAVAEFITWAGPGRHTAREVNHRVTRLGAALRDRAAS
ncbi:effector-associated domain EAD1-containing protein [Actinoplanes derwentensis]|uniref:effector-associated domain EAD1-containing protein n=1 Tax=Actinoplanes derwentensis TaxID=113562 RepID=UPI0012FD03D3|nr:effector-associated domain EAD1-containing protein [Actinoplanes derwentensis]GID87273.1 hypothetical protein Ade03nite_61970 [Actinoplanes derwentensis]